MRIFIIAPSFFGYRDRIAEELRHQGHKVDIADDRPSESVSFKSIAKIAPSLLSGAVSRYADVLCERIHTGSFDHVIYLGGMTFLFTRDQVSRMRASAPYAELSAYLWDSLANSPRISKCLDLFDRVLTFEPDDCRIGGPTLRPLFYSNSYSDYPSEPSNGFEWDACFVGSVHQPSKFLAIDSMVRSLRKQGLRVFTYYYMPSQSVLFLRSAQYPAYRCAEFSHEVLTPQLVASIYARSKAILDTSQSGQKGLTMRTLEGMGARRKLVTTNIDVLSYDFALQGNVAVWDSETGVDPGFFEIPYKMLSKDVYGSYSIESFARALLGEGAEYTGYKWGSDAS